MTQRPTTRTRRRHASLAVVILGVTSLFAVPSLSAAPPGTATDGADVIAPEHRHGPVRAENSQAGSEEWKSPELTRGRSVAGAEPVKHPANASAAGLLTGTESAIAATADPDPAFGTPKPGAPAAAAPIVWTDTVIRGYADQVSVNHGEAITFFVSTAQPTYRIEVYRMGWYRGAGARLMATSPTLTGNNQPVPSPDPDTGLIEANWQPSSTFNTSAAWTSGAYLGKLIAADGSVGYLTFVVRDDASTAGIVYQLPVTTYQAYNNWGGKSLYDFSSTGDLPAVKVSFDRPYSAWSGAGSFFDGDYNMIRWLESQGYDVTYTTSLDLHRSAAPVTGHKVFLSPWHDEYWSKPMRDNVTAARDRGMHLAWFGANNVYWQIRMEPATSGAADRVITCYKDPIADPVAATTPALTTTTWRDPPVSKPENQLLGVMYQSNFQYGTSFPWVVASPTNWVYTGTGVRAGTQIAGLVGYEFDKTFANGVSPAGLTKLSASPVTDGAGVKGTQNAGVYTAPSGAIVFSAGTIYWSWKIDDNEYQHHGADSRVQRMTANILNKMLSTVPVPPPTPVPSIPIYTDALAAGWSDASWNATITYAATTPVYAGTKSTAFVVTAAWGGFYIRSATPLSTTGHSGLTFAARSTAATQRYSVAVYGAAGEQLGRAVILTNYGGDPVSTGWTIYNVPFDADNLNVAGQAISGILIQDYSGGPQQAVYIDQLGVTD